MDIVRAMYPEVFKGDMSCIPEVDPRNITEEDTVMEMGMHPKLYKAAKEGGSNELFLFKLVEASDEFFLRRTQSGNNNILHIAARAGRDNFIAEGLRHFPVLSDQVNSQGDTPLVVAARFGHLKVVKELTKSASENGTNSSNSSSSRPPRGAVEELVHHPLEQVTRQVGMVPSPTAENETNPSSHPQSAAEEDRVDHPLEAGNIPVGTPAALENQTNSSSSHHRREVGEGIASHRLEQDTIPDSIVINMVDVINSGEGIVDHQSEQGTILDSIVINKEDVINLGDMATAMEEGPVHLQLDGLIPNHWRVTNLQGTTVTTALHEALRNGHEDVARYLLELKPEMAAFDNLAGESPLFLAAESHCQKFVKHILRSRQPYSTKGPYGQNALHAARNCDGEIVSELIRRRPDLMRQLDSLGKAAIHYAVEAEYGVLLDQMLKVDASIVLFPDRYGYTPLLRAASRGYLKICQDIIEECPESVEARNNEGRNALHLFKLKKGSDGEELFKILEIRELLNIGDDEGNTPLHLAIKEHHYDKAIFFIGRHDIDLGAVNKKGFTALDLCESSWNPLNTQGFIYMLLRRQGAPHGRRSNDLEDPVGGLDLKPFLKTMTLIATLISTVTFAAPFTMPGGFDTSLDNLGVAILVKKASLKVFILADTTAMCCSMAVMFLLLWAMITEKDDDVNDLAIISSQVLQFALLATLVAFVSVIFAVIAPKALWVPILVCIFCGIVAFISGRSNLLLARIIFWLRKLPTLVLLRTLRRQREKRGKRIVFNH